MKTIKLILALAFTFSLSSQAVYNLTYLEIPTQEISTFINLHDKITDMSFENREGVMNEFVFTHFQGAGKGVVIWSNYASVEDVYKDVRLQSVRKTWESLEGEEKENFEKMVGEYLPYWNVHTDEIRNVDYQNNVLFSDDWDWDTGFLILRLNQLRTRPNNHNLARVTDESGSNELIPAHLRYSEGGTPPIRA